MAFCAFSQHVTTFIFFLAWDRSRVELDNSQNSTQKMRTLDESYIKKERKSYVMKVSCQVHKPIVVCLVFLGISQQFCKTGHNWSNGPFSEVGSIWCTVRTVLSNLPNFLEFSWPFFVFIIYDLKPDIYF